VLGRVVDLALLAEVLDDEAITEGDRWRSLEEYVERDDGVAVFRHDLFRLASYEGLSYRRRRELHARVGGLLESRSDADVAVVALHYCEGQRHDKAWEWSRRAADDAREKRALVEAFDLYGRALHAARHCDTAAGDVAEVAERRGDAAMLLGRYDEAKAAFGLARRSARDDVLAWSRTTRKWGDVDEAAGRYAASLRSYTRALRVLEQVGTDDPAMACERVELLLAYAKTRYAQHRISDAVTRTFLALEPATVLGDQRLVAQVHMHLEVMLTDLGNPAAVQHGEAALALLRELGDDVRLANVLLNLGWTAFLRSDWTTALSYYAESRTAYRRAGDVVGAALAQNNEAELLTDQGRYDEARSLLDDARRVWRAAGYRVGVVMTTSGLSRLELRAGRIGSAEAMLAEALDEFRVLGAMSYVLDASVRQVECLLYANRPGEAIALATRIERELASAAVPVLPATLARFHGMALLQRGDRGAAVVKLREAVAAARHAEADYEVARCLEALLAAGDPEVDLAEPLGILDRLGVVASPTLPLPG
jgi:tetratricopeptide (TPR) repeat protein